MPKQPNIVYILSDEHRGQAMSHAGDPNVKTPVMDRLAHEGVSFSRAYANCPICTPSRGSIFSGRHAHAGPVSGFFDVYKATAPSIATILQEHGYHTAYVGKWHCGTVRNQVSAYVQERPDEFKGVKTRTPECHRAGFQDWFGFENLNQHFNSYYYKKDDTNPTKVKGYETDGLTDVAIDYLKNYDKNKPVFLVLSITPPHFPLIVPDKWKRFDPGTLEVRSNFNEDLQDARENLANYYAMIENLDWNMGRLMEQVAASIGQENTLTVYFSDHGEYMGSHGLQSRKEHPHEESVRIPAIFHWPEGIAAQGNIEGLFSLVDLMPSTLSLADIPIPAHNQGFNFAPTITGKEQVSPQAVLMEMHNNPRWSLDFLDWRGFVDQRWKYAFYETGEELLFDLEKDPFELDNLAKKYPDLAREKRRVLLDLLAESREPYFDVLIEHGAPYREPKDISVKAEKHPGLDAE